MGYESSLWGGEGSGFRAAGSVGGGGGGAKP